MHLPAKANSLTVQTFMANKSLSDSDSDSDMLDMVIYSSLAHASKPNSPSSLSSLKRQGLSWWGDEAGGTEVHTDGRADPRQVLGNEGDLLLV